MAASMKHQVRAQAPSKRDFLDMSSITKDELDGLLSLAARPLLDWGWDAMSDDIPPPLTLKMPSRPLPRPDF